MATPRTDAAARRATAPPWRETLLIVPLAAAVLLAMTRAAFRAYFFGEAFLYLGQYWAAGGDFWRALASPSDVIFFKPVCFAVSLPWYFLLPLDPLPYHVRNFVLSVVNVALLHRVLLRLVARRWARLLALMLFAVSKIHLTTIGYLMIFDSIVLLFFLLSSLLFALRWCAERRQRDYACALLCCGLCVFTKDYAIVAAGVVLVLVATRGGGRPAIAAWAAPLTLLVAVRVALRYAVAGPMPWWHPVYAPDFSLVEVFRKGIIFLSGLTNLSVGWHDKTGASGLGSVISLLGWPGHAAAPTLARIEPAEWIDGVAGLALLALLIVTAAETRPTLRARARTLAFPVAWILAFLAAPLFIRNLQMYYVYESVAGAAVLFGVILEGVRRRLLIAWTIAVAAIGIAGAASNAGALYDWQYAADAARRIEAPVIHVYRGSPIQSLTFVTADRVFWRWVLTADDKGPMVETLLDRPGLRVSVLDRNDPAHAPRDSNDAHIVLDADAGFAPIRREPHGSTRTLRRLLGGFTRWSACCYGPPLPSR